MNSKDISVLVVDSDEFVRRLLAKYLGAEYWCAVAATPAEAFEMLENRFFNVLILDVTMPGASALALCHAAHRISPETVTVVMSGRSDVQDLGDDAVEYGAFGFVRKPFDLSQMLISVERALILQSLITDARNHQQQSEARGYREVVSALA